MVMDLTRLADYNLWANDLTREKLGTLTEEEFSRGVIPPYGSIKNLVTRARGSGDECFEADG
jgi:uncharacterized damage-inducible protein DinB